MSSRLRDYCLDGAGLSGSVLVTGGGDEGAWRTTGAGGGGGGEYLGVASGTRDGGGGADRPSGRDSRTGCCVPVDVVGSMRGVVTRSIGARPCGTEPNGDGR